jgi:ribosomal silencing factor RsfS
METERERYDLVEFVAEVNRVNVVTFEVRKHYNLDALSKECRLKSP